MDDELKDTEGTEPDDVFLSKPKKGKLSGLDDDLDTDLEDVSVDDTKEEEDDMDEESLDELADMEDEEEEEETDNW